MKHLTLPLLSLPMLSLCVLPVFALMTASGPAQLGAGLHHPQLLPALWLTLWTSSLSMCIAVVLGTPLAWWLSRDRKLHGVVSALVEWPLVLPPAVMGLSLLLLFGGESWLGRGLGTIGVQLPFTGVAVVLAQLTVGAPYYVQSAAAALRTVSTESLEVAQTLGASDLQQWRWIIIPQALAGMVSGAMLCWARALGEFGATLVFAGSLQGVTRTMPVAIYSALASDLSLSLALAAIYVLAAGALLLALGWLRRGS